MDQYNLTKNEINKILDSNEITYDGTYISAYELKSIINNELKELFDIFNNEQKTVKSINEKSKNFISKLLNKKQTNELDHISFYTKRKDNIQEIVFCLKNKHNLTIICKEPNNDNLFFKYQKADEEEKKLIKDNIEYIMNTFNIIEYFTSKYNFSIDCKEISSSDQQQKFQHEIFNINFSITNQANITINVNNELTETFNKEWLSRENLRKYTNENEEKLLKRIPININELNSLYSKIITSSLEKRKIKTLKK